MGGPDRGSLMHRVYTQAFRSGPMGRIMKKKLAFHTGSNSRPLRSGLGTRVVFQYLLYAGCKKKVNASLERNPRNCRNISAANRCQRQTRKAFGNRQSQARRCIACAKKREG